VSVGHIYTSDHATTSLPKIGTKLAKMMNFDILKSEVLSQSVKIIILLVILAFLLLFNNSLSELHECLIAFMKVNGYTFKNGTLV